MASILTVSGPTLSYRVGALESKPPCNCAASYRPFALSPRCITRRRHGDRSKPERTTKTPITLEKARKIRPLSFHEIRHVMKCILEDLSKIHKRGLVHTGLRMENVSLVGFNPLKPDNPLKLQVILGGHDSISRAGSRRPIYSLAYRPPEVYYNRQWDSSADIWAWGIMLAHLILSSAAFGEETIIDDYARLRTGGNEQKTAKAWITRSFRFDLAPFYSFEEVQDAKNIKEISDDEHDPWWYFLESKGVHPADVDFLGDVLKLIPTNRPTADYILGDPWFYN